MVGPFAPFGRDNNPTPNHGIFSQLRHLPTPLSFPPTFFITADPRFVQQNLRARLRGAVNFLREILWRRGKFPTSPCGWLPVGCAQPSGSVCPVLPCTPLALLRQRF